MKVGGIIASLSGVWIHELSSSQAQGTGRGLDRAGRQAMGSSRVPSFLIFSSCRDHVVCLGQKAPLALLDLL